MIKDHFMKTLKGPTIKFLVLTGIIVLVLAYKVEALEVLKNHVYVAEFFTPIVYFVWSMLTFLIAIPGIRIFKAGKKDLASLFEYYFVGFVGVVLFAISVQFFLSLSAK